MALITTDDLTNTGNTGCFDLLMQSVESRLTALVSQGHIGTKEYSDIYSASLVAVLQQSMQFTLQKQINDAQAELLKEQTATQTKQTLLAAEQITQAQTETLKTQKEVDLLDQRKLTEVQQTALVAAQAALTGTQEALATQQIAESVSKVALSNAQKLLVDTNVLKSTEEKNLLAQKVISERAQTRDTLEDGVTQVSGVIGKQKALYEAQKEGFANDLLHKVAKLMQDTFTVERGTNSNVQAIDAGLGDPNKNAVISELMTRVGATYVAPEPPAPPPEA